MFGFFRKKQPAPALRPSNPGVGAAGNVSFTNEERTWTESFDLVPLAAAVLRGHGHTVVQEKAWLAHPESGYVITPQVAAIEPRDDGSVQTVTTIQLNHPTLAPDGVFEYQHSTGDSVADAVSKGFDQWAQVDLVTLLDAARPTPASCMVMDMEFPAADGRPARVRRAVLGPVAHFAQHRPAEPHRVGGDAGDAASDDDEHPFCACCLLTRSFETFKELIEGDTFFGLRLFAAREPDGTPQADCRVNGDDWEPGAAALRAYAATWPAAGYEFRKQYVVLQTLPAGRT